MGTCFEYIVFSKCKFSKHCELYSKDSYTCLHNGGDYCGYFRELELKGGKQ